MNFIEWSNPENWDGAQYLAHPCQRLVFGNDERIVYVDSDTIDLHIDRLERQIPVVFEEKDKLFLHSVGVCGD